MLKIENKYWKRGLNFIAGIDEAGRGPLAGPVVAACVIFKQGITIEGIKDSKKISAKKRDILFEEIIAHAYQVGIGVVHEDIVDKINILNATHHAMKCALGEISIKPDIVLIDGRDTHMKHYEIKHIISMKSGCKDT